MNYELIETYRKLQNAHKRKAQNEPLYYIKGMASKQDKPPKLRFRPGNIFKNKKTGELSEVVFCFRTSDNTREWLFCLEERTSLLTVQDRMADLSELLIPFTGSRIEYRVFRTTMDALQYFFNIACRGSWREIRSNKTVLNDYELVSSGSIE